MHTEDGGTLFYEKGVFNVAVKPDELAPGLRSPFFDDLAGSVIFHVNYDQRHYKHYHYQDGRFVTFEIEGVSEDSLLVLIDREGGLWFADEQGFRRVKDGNVKNYGLSEFNSGKINKTSKEDGLPDDYIVAFLQTSEGSKVNGRPGPDSRLQR
jgi:hypothetical protein